MGQYLKWLLRQLPGTVREQAEFFAFWGPLVVGLVALLLKWVNVRIPLPGLVYVVVVAVAVVWRLLRVNYQEIVCHKRMVRALALIHAPGVEEIQPISREGKQLTFEDIDTDEEFAAWGEKVDEWWKRFEGLEPQLTLLERNQIAYMDSADRDGSSPPSNFSPQYLERWRNVKSTWQTLDRIMESRETLRQAVRSEMMKEGFDPQLLPPHFVEAEIKRLPPI